MKKVHPTMNPENNTETVDERKAFMCSYIIANYINPAIYVMNVIIYLFLYFFPFYF